MAKRLRREVLRHAVAGSARSSQNSSSRALDRLELPLIARAELGVAHVVIALATKTVVAIEQ